jgi:hypothetical protein
MGLLESRQSRLTRQMLKGSSGIDQAFADI